MEVVIEQLPAIVVVSAKDPLTGDESDELVVCVVQALKEGNDNLVVDLSESERQSLGSDLEQILDYVAQINELDTSEVPPTFQILECEQSLREDTVLPSLPRDQALANAALKDADHFEVPPVIAGDEGGIADEGIEHA